MKDLRRKKSKQESVANYLAWAYADPKYREFTDTMVKEYLDTGVRPDVEARFKEWIDGRNSDNNNKSGDTSIKPKTVHRDPQRRLPSPEKEK